MSTPGHRTRIVILGASYARGWNPSDPRIEFINRGGDGQESWELLARFDRDVLADAPDAVVIWGFINDIFRAKGAVDAAIERARASIVEMIERAQRAGIEPILATEVPIRGKGGWKDLLGSLLGPLTGKKSYQDRVNAHVRAVNDWLRGVARERNLVLLDFYAAVVDGRGQRQKAFATADGSHITKAAYDALSATALKALTAREAPRRK